MSKNIADLYEEVMNEAAAEKTASAATFDRGFFEKVASGEEDAVEALNSFIEEARAEGHGDDEIEAAIAEAMSDAGVDDDEEDGEDDGEDDGDFEMAKSAAYSEGAEEAYAHVMEKAAAFGVTEDDILEYHLGLAKGQGYAETRQALEEVVEKIAAAKGAGAGDFAGKIKDILLAKRMRHGMANMKAGKKVQEAGEKLIAKSKSPQMLTGGAGDAMKALKGELGGKRIAAGKAQQEIGRADRNKGALQTGAAYAGLGAAVGSAAYGGKKMYDRRSK
jgi:hypothetical protein